MKVLIADDSRAVRERMKMLLAEVRAVKIIEEAENVQQAIDRVKELVPDIVILDMRMPGGSGIDVMQQIEKKNHLPLIIMLTNFSHPVHKRKCMEAGADYFFDKSAEFERVIDILKSAVDRPNDDPLTCS